MRHEDALIIANRLRLILQPVCQKVKIAGSLRRQRPNVGDAELVILPQPNTLFGTVDLTQSTEAHKAIAQMLEDNVLAVNPERQCDGLKYKQLVDPETGLKIDLFFTNEQNFGNTLAYRTGDEHFSKGCVTPRKLGGLMPWGLRQVEGHLWTFNSKGENVSIVPCLREEDWFTALGVRTLPPPERDGRAIIFLREELKNATQS